MGYVSSLISVLEISKCWMEAKEQGGCGCTPWLIGNLKPLSRYLWSLNGKGIAYISVGTRKRAEKVSVPEINYCNCRSVSWMMLYYPASKTRIVVHGPLLLNILRSAVGRRCIGTGAVWAGVQLWGAGCLTAGAGRWVLHWFSVQFTKGLGLWMWGSQMSRVEVYSHCGCRRWIRGHLYVCNCRQNVRHIVQIHIWLVRAYLNVYFFSHQIC